MAKALTPTEMYELCGGSPKHCTFDFSTIPIDDYQQFFEALPNFLYKKVESVEFNRNLYRKTDTTREERRILRSSIAIKQPHFMQFVCKVLTAALPRSKTLKSIFINGIHINHKYADPFFEAASKCKTLKSIRVHNCPLHDYSVVHFLAVHSPYHLERIEFINCEIPREIRESVCTFLTQRQQKLWKLSVFDLSSNKFTLEDLERFDFLLHLEGKEEEQNVQNPKKAEKTEIHTPELESKPNEEEKPQQEQEQEEIHEPEPDLTPSPPAEEESKEIPIPQEEEKNEEEESSVFAEIEGSGDDKEEPMQLEITDDAEEGNDHNEEEEVHNEEEEKQMMLLLSSDEDHVEEEDKQE